MSAKGLRAIEGGSDFASVLLLAEQTPVESLPELVGRLAQAQAVAGLRMASAGRPEPTGGVDGLLTVEEVAGLLRISEQNVYARAKTDFRPAAVDVGPGQLRFDRLSIQKFINARRRG